MTKPNSIVYDNFLRPDKALVNQFSSIPVANIDDCMGRQAAIHSTIKPVGKCNLVGPALTVKVPPGDNLMLHYALDIAQEGDVIVIDAGGLTDRAIFGSLIVEYLITKKIAGIIVDGAIRDFDEISRCSIPVYAKGVTPDGPWKNGPGEVNTPICCGGRVVHPGDIVVADADGVVFIRSYDAEEILQSAQKIMKVESEVLKNIHEKGEMNRPWLNAKLDSLNICHKDIYI